MKILLIEDEPKTLLSLRQGLEENGIEVDIAYDGMIGKHLAKKNQYQIIVSDIIMPGINGLQMSKELRQEGITTPILMLTALGSIEEKLMGFDAGADDYLVKPFEFKELLARLRALTKRYTDNVQEIKVLGIADLEMNLDEKSVRRSGKQIDLTAKEFGLLEYFLKNKNRVISRTEIAEKVWDIHFDTGTNVIDVYINFLRKKIDKEFTPKLIHTMVGMGYVLKVEE